MCILRGYPEDFECSGGLEGHHILRRSLVWGNPKAKKHLDNPALIVPICKAHNQSRWADTHEGRRQLLLHMNTVTRGRTRRMVETIPWKHPENHKDLTWLALTEKKT